MPDQQIRHCTSCGAILHQTYAYCDRCLKPNPRADGSNPKREPGKIPNVTLSPACRPWLLTT